MTAQFIGVTEIAGQKISAEQLDRTCHRYHWATRRAEGRQVLEVACGAGLGIGLVAAAVATMAAGDFSPEVLDNARAAVPEDVALSVFSAEDLPFEDGSFDTILMFEAIYYVPRPEQFFAEAHRVLRPGGELLLVTCNKDLFDFTPSPFSHCYYGVLELGEALGRFGFATRFYGYTEVGRLPLRQRVLRPIKAIAGRLGLIPRTMHGKSWLKKLFFGRMTEMPASIAELAYSYSEPVPLAADRADKLHKVIYCIATRDASASSGTNLEGLPS